MITRCNILPTKQVLHSSPLSNRLFSPLPSSFSPFCLAPHVDTEERWGKLARCTSRGSWMSAAYLISTMRRLQQRPPSFALSYSLTLSLVSSLNNFFLSIATQFHCSPVLCNYGRHEMHLNAESGFPASTFIPVPSASFPRLPFNNIYSAIFFSPPSSF